ncbi:MULTISPECIES: DUF1176 domain-containing protein [unclassified Sphingomonas]|uniref:DUF1176 domain-containing protein n=1 Tax=unclassified Sphingomonas TaxID=196159 RepID=UPI0006F2A2E4|nr:MULTISPECIES: DUF1176 domain-containing protein [unclassified Sphingomonas]KQM58936.1 hypothetical protein ASE65_11370 [Sphingomonas sp. Leaf16]KQN11191.1 hypothetical protein ASE81_12360 [Sphingomonas sp. Leaf29]KQN18489.1 hypothetical protein ASE83_12285 [Sphingomonas sp. Leaf32]
MHRILPLALPLALFACNEASPEPDGRTATPVPTPGANPVPTTDTGTVPHPTSLRRFGDWVAGCDNGASCQAGSLAPEEGDPPALMLSVERAAGPEGGIVMRLRGSSLPALPLTAAIDGDAVARGGTTRDDAVELTGAPALALAERMAQGHVLTITDAAGAAAATLSLQGVAAALRWIDAEQGRAGTTGALVAKGTGAATRPAPSLPVVRAPAIRGESALLDPLLITRMRQQAACEGDDLPPATTKPLGGGRTLAIVPCSLGAYNLLSALFVVEQGAAKLAAFDTAPGGDSGSETPLAFNAAFEDGILDTNALGRGLGDCGVRQRYAWDGTRFRLIEQRQMDDCRGNADFIRTWTARLIR